MFKKISKLLLKLLGIKTCYYCSKHFRNGYKWRVSESPKDENGVRVDVCKKCFYKIAEIE